LVIKAGGKDIRIWPFDPKQKEKQPAVLLLHGADGGAGEQKMYCGVVRAASASDNQAGSPRQ
jgi:hypothetical protein